MGALKVLFLEDGAQTAESVARWLADIIATARVSVDLAIYDCHLEGESADIFVGALQERERAGVALRILYNEPRTLPPEGVVADPSHPTETAAFFAANHLPALSVGDSPGGSHLMHHKYLLVDAGTPEGRLWMGSANITTAAFTRQENNLLDIASPALVAAYAADFETPRSGCASRPNRGQRSIMKWRSASARLSAR
jgi:phosphatidylserine/phosphatidylglycerophosphate/cardiolipin synthase-like enzyme